MQGYLKVALIPVSPTSDYTVDTPIPLLRSPPPYCFIKKSKAELKRK